MARDIPADELDDLLTALRDAEASLGVGDIETRLRHAVPRRTLQSRLQTLVRRGVLAKEGSGRATRYRLASVIDRKTDAGSDSMPISADGKIVLDQVSRPLAARKPVGYGRDFLDAYEPGKTRYLPPDLSMELQALGRVRPADQEAGTYAKQILQRLLVDLAWNSSRLEGNTYSLIDTRRLIAFGEVAEGKDARDAQMILNHKEAIEFLVRNAGEIGLDRYTILNLHALLADNLLPDPSAPGRLRQIAVGIEGSSFHPLEVPGLIEECFDTILAKATRVADPLEQAFFVLAHLPYLQPFEDVNKRVARLAANVPMIRANLAPLSFDGVPQDLYTKAMLAIYERQDLSLLRDIFAFAYRRSVQSYAAIRQSLGEPDPFRMRYRGELGKVVAGIVCAALPRREAVSEIRDHANRHIPANDREVFRQIVEDELLALHAGNFARYRIKPSDFEAWQSRWNDSTSVVSPFRNGSRIGSKS